MNMLRRRRISNAVAFAASMVATAIGLAILCAILWTLLSNGFAAMSWSLFTQMSRLRAARAGSSTPSTAAWR